MKKFVTLLLAMVMIFSLATTAFAANITVDGAKNDETYTAYKIFDVSINEGETAYAYTITASSPWKTFIDAFTYNEQDVFTLTPSANNPDVLVVTENIDVEYGADLAAYLAENIPASAEKKVVVAADNEAKFTGLDAGYYFVDTTLGSLCSLFTTDSNAELKEKNTIPSLTKTQSDNALQIGEDVTYTITVTDAKGTDAAITVHDVMEAGLTLKADSFEIKVGDVAVAAENYTITTTGLTDDCTFEIELKADYVKSLAEGTQVVITYKATLDKDAEIAPETNDNTAWLTYSEQTTEEVVVKLSTYEFDLDKVDKDGNALDGAKFKLYDAETAGNVIKVVATETAGVYRVADATETGIEEMATDTNGELTVTGLDNKPYYLEETAAPAGYNKLTSRVAVDLSNGNKIDDAAIDVVNQAGTELPSTGGMGTTLFYVFGGLMMLAAVVLLVTKKRMAAAE